MSTFETLAVVVAVYLVVFVAHRASRALEVRPERDEPEGALPERVEVG